MTQALPEVPNTTFVQPDPVNETKPILAGVPYPDGVPHSDLYYIDRSDPTGPPPTDPAADPQFNNWETALQAWVAANPSTLQQASQAPQPPTSQPTPPETNASSSVNL